MEETNSSLKGLCDLLADQGSEYARQHTENFLGITKNTTDKEVSREQADETFIIFSFLNWALVSRIWSYIKNTALRKDLKGQIYKSIIRKTSYVLSEDKSTEGVDLFASKIDQEFRELVLSYNAGIDGIAGLAARIFANKVKRVGFKWLQELFDLNDEEMEVIESEFNNRVDNFARIEDSARQVYLKANQSERGFFKRILGLITWTDTDIKN